MNETQPLLFDARPAPADVRPTDPSIHPVKAKKLGPFQQAVYDALRRAGRAGASTRDLALITHRFSARIHDLKAAGYVIDSRADANGNYRYYLLD